MINSELTTFHQIYFGDIFFIINLTQILNTETVI